MEKQTILTNRIGIAFLLLLLASVTVCLFLIALNNRYMMIDNVFILDKWTRTIYLNKGEDKIRKISSQSSKTINVNEFLQQIK